MQLVARRNDFLLSAPIGSFDAYLDRVAQIPVLSREREQELAQRLRDANDLAAARELVLSHLRFVVHVARGYSGYGLPLGDLVQEGNVGLMKAVKRFDPALGVRLVSFAVHWIRAEIHEYVLRNWMFFGDHEYATKSYSADPVVKFSNTRRYDYIDEIPESLRERRRDLGIEYGKFDFVMRDGEAILLDANKTPVSQRTPTSPGPNITHLAEAIERLAGAAS